MTPHPWTATCDFLPMRLPILCDYTKVLSPYAHAIVLGAVLGAGLGSARRLMSRRVLYRRRYHRPRTAHDTMALDWHH